MKLNLKLNKNKIFKILAIFFVCFMLFVNGSCDKKEEEADSEHECTTFEWVLEETDAACLDMAFYDYNCTVCGKTYDVKEMVRPHEFSVLEDVPATCYEDGYTKYRCDVCGFEYSEKYAALNHPDFVYEVVSEPTDNTPGTRNKCCTSCGEVLGTYFYADNGYDTHGKLSVKGTDLVDQYGEKFQLVGLSTHGLQWCDRFVNLTTFENLRNEFGINVIRLSLYPDEGGYCVLTGSAKEDLYQELCRGIDACTKLNMYVVIDWHMLGSNFHQADAIEFFKRITTQYEGYDNILYEIMNEPYGDNITTTTCRQYANYVIPIIREKSDGIILVGGPHWSADLNGWANKPLEYDNLMYVYHFYANGDSNANVLRTFYNKGLPIFVSEHGGMESTGDGPLDYTSINSWWDIMQELNMSHIAWNISNTKGSASIFKYNTSDYYDVSDDNLKEWGAYYKQHVRKIFGLSNIKKNF